MQNPFPRPDLDWEFVEKHYPDYHRCGIICQSSDMGACLEFAELDPDMPITEESVGRLKALAPDREYSTEPSYCQVRAFDGYIGSGLTFGEASQKTDDYCLARAILHCPADEALPDAYVQWANAVLNG